MSERTRAADEGSGRGWLTSGSRLAGVDLARGLAVLGMLAAHLLTIEAFDFARPDTWVGVAGGRSSILFAVLAGVSIALVSGGPVPAPAEALRTVRLRLTVRAALLWVIGVVLILTGVPVYVILPAYAILFLLALPLLALRARTLWAVAGASGLVLPLLQPVFDALPLWDVPAGEDLALLVGWHYPFTLWFAFLVAGLAAGRSDLRAIRTQLALLAGGVTAALAGYGAAALTGVGEADAPVEALPDGEAGLTANSWIAAVWTADAHSGGLLEVVGSGGFALAVLGACLLLCRTVLALIVLPLRAVGAMPLTAYVGQLAVWAVAASVLLGETGDLTAFRALDPLGVFVVSTLAFCTAWALLLGRGPLERLLAWAARRIVSA
jgi:uncharacterized membrane protein YeiB